MQPNIQWKFNFGETIILLILDCTAACATEQHLTSYVILTYSTQKRVNASYRPYHQEEKSVALSLLYILRKEHK